MQDEVWGVFILWPQISDEGADTDLKCCFFKPDFGQSEPGFNLFSFHSNSPNHFFYLAFCGVVNKTNGEMLQIRTSKHI